MRGIPEFNFPQFNQAAAYLKEMGHEVFSPAARDEEHYGKDLANATGSEEEAIKTHGFSLRKALEVDTTWICRHADAILLLGGWENSAGARAELALAKALRLRVFLYTEVETPDFPEMHEVNW